MSDLAKAIIDYGVDGQARFQIGQVRESADGPYVTVQGSRIGALWAEGLCATEGDSVLLAFMQEAQDQTTAVALCKVSSGPRPCTGVVKTFSAATSIVTLETTRGDVEAIFAGGVPSHGTAVAILWGGQRPVAFATREVPAVKRDDIEEIPSPPGAPTVGTLNVAAAWSGSWDQGRSTWDSAVANPSQGLWASYGPFIGAWFYGDGFAAVTGTQVTGCRIRLGARRRQGRHGALVNFRLQRHGDSWRSGPPQLSGDVATVAVAPHASAQWHELPASIGQDLANFGGGIALVGSDYAGVEGVSLDAASGQIQIDWRR